ncbi:acyl-CoA N-acyltransferase [Chytridium lagenaria]|nr:acyl-CoA N-acyltransferase [Chytridium lagenaria]
MWSSFLSALSLQTPQSPSPTRSSPKPVEAPLWEWVPMSSPSTSFQTEGYLRRRNPTLLSPFDRYFHRPTPGSLLVSRQVTLPSHQNAWLSFKAFDVEDATHLGCLHAWMNEDRVAKFWGEQGPVEHQRRYIRTLPWHSIPIGPSRPYPPLPPTNTYDRGFHILVGDPSMLGTFPIWAPVILTWCFFDEPRCTKAYGEPRIDNEKFIEGLIAFGFERLGEDIQMPHKRAALIGFREETFRGKVVGERWRREWLRLKEEVGGMKARL